MQDLIKVAVVAAFVLIPALIARNKGRSFRLWICYAFFLWPIALIHSLLIKRNSVRQSYPDRKPLQQRGLKRCVECSEIIMLNADICAHCGSNNPVDTTSTPALIWGRQSKN